MLVTRLFYCNSTYYTNIMEDINAKLQQQQVLYPLSLLFIAI